MSRFTPPLPPLPTVPISGGFLNPTVLDTTAPAPAPAPAPADAAHAVALFTIDGPLTPNAFIFGTPGMGNTVPRKAVR